MKLDGWNRRAYDHAFLFFVSPKPAHPARRYGKAEKAARKNTGEVKSIAPYPSLAACQEGPTAAAEKMHGAAGSEQVVIVSLVV